MQAPNLKPMKLYLYINYKLITAKKMIHHKPRLTKYLKCINYY